MRLKISALAVLASLAACGSGGGVALENVTAEEAANAARDQIALEPGQWETEGRITNLTWPGAPQQLRDAMAASLAQAQTSSECVTPEEAANPSARMLGGQGEQCRYERFNLSGGTLDAAMICAAPGGQGEMTATLKGTYAPTEYALTMAARMTMPGGADAEGMAMDVSVTGRRTGECPG